MVQQPEDLSLPSWYLLVRHLVVPQSPCTNIWMVIQRYSPGPATKTLCLFNPCPLTDAVRAALDALGQVKVVVVNNCFHYLFAVQYCDAYGPLGARVPVPSSLLVKCPALKEKSAVRTLPSAQEG